MYDDPYPNDEELPSTEALKLNGTQKIAAEITLRSSQDIEAVFRMTPYYYHTSQKDRDKLSGLETLTTEIEFVIAEYEKP